MSEQGRIRRFASWNLKRAFGIKVFSTQHHMLRKMLPTMFRTRSTSCGRKAG